MKLTKETLKQIIKEELEAVMNEDGNDAAVRRGVHGLSTLNPADKEERSAAFKSGQQTKQNQFDNTEKIRADLDDDGQFKSEPGPKQPSTLDKIDAEEAVAAMEKKGKVIKSKIIPWVEKNAKTLWQKTPLRSEQEFLNRLSRLADMDDEEVASKESSLIDMLGNDLYDSIVNNRGFLDKFGGLFKRGTFSENKRR